MTSPGMPLNGWRPFVAAVIAAMATVAICYLAAPGNLAAAPPAQIGTLSMEISKRLQGSDVIQVGQELTFTIRITNTGTISITTLPLIDEYESSILQLERTDPLSSTNIVTPETGSGLITWSDLTTDTVFGPLNPGQSIEIITVFRAIAPRVATVNRARIGAAVGFGGQEYAGEGRSSSGDAIGGQVIVRKEVLTDTVAASGLPLTFTITISNDGAADLTRIPLRDTFDLTYLEFAGAVPTPTVTSVVTEGILEWDDVLPGLGLTRLRPGEVITITTVFTALRSVDAAFINRAEAVGVRDEFDDEVPAPRQAEVPIRIIPGPAEATRTPAPTTIPTPIPRDEPQPRPTDVPATPTATPTPTVEALTATPTPEAAGVAVTPTVPAPATLPRTGGSTGMPWILAAVALAIGAALALRSRVRF